MQGLFLNLGVSLILVNKEKRLKKWRVFQTISTK
jgi:hypothetical protein